MRPLERQVLYNAFRLVESLRDGRTINRDELIEELRKPIPPRRDLSDAVILHGYRHYVINAGVKSAHRVITYEEASLLTGKSVEAIRQAAYRKAIIRLTEYRDGRERAGVVFNSLAAWLKWSPEKFRKVERTLNEIRRQEPSDDR